MMRLVLCASLAAALPGTHELLQYEVDLEKPPQSRYSEAGRHLRRSLLKKPSKEFLKERVK